MEHVKLGYRSATSKRTRVWLRPLLLGGVHFFLSVLFVIGGKIIWQLTYEDGKPNVGKDMLHIGMAMQYPLAWLDRTGGDSLGWLVCFANSMLWGLFLAGLVLLGRKMAQR